MQLVFIILQVTTGILFMLTVLMQSRASGLSATFGGSGAVVVQRRGAEKVVYRASIYLCIAFFALAVIQWYV